MDTYTFITELIKSVAALLWPIIVIIFGTIYRKQISTALSRLKIRKLELLGQKIELEPEADQLREAVQKTDQEIPEVPTIRPLSDNEQLAIETNELDEDINEVLEAAQVNPRLGIMQLSSLLERDLRNIAALLGLPDSKARVSPSRLLTTLVGKGFLPRHTTNSLKIFWELRNRIVHAHEAVDEDSILGVLDTGLELLKRVRSIPHETHFVYNPCVDLFSDEGCTKLREGVKGIILESKTADGARTYKRIFPTTRCEYYKKGRQVTWEWDLSKSWGQTWYVSPDTDEKKLAWSSSGEFTGRHTEDL